MRTYRQRVVHCLRQCPAPVPLALLEAAWPGKGVYVRRAVASLVAAGRLVEDPPGHVGINWPHVNAQLALKYPATAPHRTQSPRR